MGQANAFLCEFGEPLLLSAYLISAGRCGKRFGFHTWCVVPFHPGLLPLLIASLWCAVSSNALTADRFPVT